MAACLLGLSLLTLAARLPGGFRSVAGRLECPTQVMQDEALHVDYSRVFLSHHSPYVDFRQGPPYVHCSYPPLYYLAQAGVQREGGGLFTSGRWVSFGAFLTLLFLVALWGASRWHWAAAVAVPLALAVSPTWDAWATVDRCDLLMVALNFASIVVWLTWVEKGSEEGVGSLAPALLSGLLHAAALWTKQTAWGWGAAVVLASIPAKRWRLLAAFMLGAYVPSAVALAGMQAATHGMFLQHTFVWPVGVFDLHVLFHQLSGNWLRECAPLLLLGAVGLRWGGKVSRALALWFGLQCLGTIALGRLQSAENYYLEAMLAGWVVSAETLAAPRSRVSFPAAGWVLVAAVSLAPLAQPPVPSAGEREAKLQAAAWLTGHGPCLAVDADLVVLSGRPLWYQPSTFWLLHQSGRWDPSGLQERLRRHEVEWVEWYDLPSQTLLPPEVEGTIRGEYVPVYRGWGRVFLRPRGLEAKRGDKPASALPAAQKR